MLYPTAGELVPDTNMSQGFTQSSWCTTWILLLVIKGPRAFQLAGDANCQDWVLFFMAVGSVLPQGVSKNVIWELGPGMGASRLLQLAQPVSKMQSKVIFIHFSPFLKQK